MVFANLEPLCMNTGGNVGLNCDGGYAEYIKLPAHIFIKLPAGLDYKAHPAEIGVITDALATPYKVLRRARIEAGETVAIFGAGGGSGNPSSDDGEMGESPGDRHRHSLRPSSMPAARPVPTRWSIPAAPTWWRRCSI